MNRSEAFKLESEPEVCHPSLCAKCEQQRELKLINLDVRQTHPEPPDSVTQEKTPQFTRGEYLRLSLCYYHEKKTRGLFDVTVEQIRESRGIFGSQIPSRFKFYRRKAMTD